MSCVSDLNSQSLSLFTYYWDSRIGLSYRYGNWFCLPLLPPFSSTTQNLRTSCRFPSKGRPSSFIYRPWILFLVTTSIRTLGRRNSFISLFSSPDFSFLDSHSTLFSFWRVRSSTYLFLPFSPPTSPLRSPPSLKLYFDQKLPYTVFVMEDVPFMVDLYSTGHNRRRSTTYT